MSSKFHTIMAPLAFLLFIPAPSGAAEESDKGRFYAAPVVGGYFFEGNQRLDNGPAYGLGLGYKITERWAVEAVGLQVDSEVNPGSRTVDGLQGRLEGLYHFKSMQRITPYLAAGAGIMRLQPDPVDDPGGQEDSDPLFAYGGGIEFRLSNTLSLRTDLRHVFTFHRAYHNFLPTVGLIYTFGENEAALSREPSAEVPLPQNQHPGPPASDDERTERPLQTGQALVPPLKPSPTLREKPVITSVSGEGALVFQGVLFDYNRADIHPEFHPALRALALVLKRHPSLNIEIQGHTDNIASHGYNLDLSERRAAAVKRYLKNAGILANRMTTRGFSFDRPTADNATKEGRALNRRVEILPMP